MYIPATAFLCRNNRAPRPRNVADRCSSLRVLRVDEAVQHESIERIKAAPRTLHLVRIASDK